MTQKGSVCILLRSSFYDVIRICRIAMWIQTKWQNVLRKFKWQRTFQRRLCICLIYLQRLFIDSSINYTTTTIFHNRYLILSRSCLISELPQNCRQNRFTFWEFFPMAMKERARAAKKAFEILRFVINSRITHFSQKKVWTFLMKNGRLRVQRRICFFYFSLEKWASHFVNPTG